MSRIKSFLRVFLLWTLTGTACRAVFLAVHHSLFSASGASGCLLALWHGLRLDVAVGAYLTAMPGLLLTVSLWWRGGALRVLWKAYIAIAASAYSLACVANAALYGYWGFPLDNTPLLYVSTSPAAAAASLHWWQLALAVVSVAAVAAAVCRLPFRMPSDPLRPRARQAAATAVLLLMEVALLLPIRGGLGTGTNHTGSVYFSSDTRLNHAAVNPVFSFVEAVLHQQDIGTRYRFMADGEATRLFDGLTCTTLRDARLSARRPNVIIISLESFSDSIMRVPGVTPHLLRLCREGWYFPHFYANSFRTDRALVSIHSGLPAQPTMSIMDMPRKSTSLPSIAGALAREGYSTAFYYGGDVNYSNMRSYFMGTGFQRVVSEADFPSAERTGKWGAADGPVFDRMLADIRRHSRRQPFFKSIMTESSHEPFDVPSYRKMAGNPVFNAFSYADHCLGRFMDSLRKEPCWDSTLVAIVPDHMGAWPDCADNYMPWRFHVPFVLAGGVIDGSREWTVHGSQIDIAATILGLLGIDHSEFTYSKDLLDAAAPHFAFYTFPDAVGMVTDSCAVVWDNTSNRIVTATGTGADSLAVRAKAYLQKLFDDLESR